MRQPSHTPAERLNIQALEREAEAERIIKQAVFAEIVKFTDDAYHTMFIKEHKMYEVILGRNGKPEQNADGTPKIRELSFEEKKIYRLMVQARYMLLQMVYLMILMMLLYMQRRIILN